MYWKLLCRRGHHSGQSFEFDAPSVTLGRAADNSLALDPAQEGRVSAHHCEFFEQNGAVLVKDSGSTNGTLVNGVKIQAPTPIFKGFRVALGEKGPEFELDCGPLAPLDRTIADAAPPPKAPAPPKPAAAAVPALSLACRSGALAGRTFEFTAEAVTVGRGEGNTLRLDPYQDQSAGTNHAEIRFKHGAYVLIDKNSRNGTFVNGQKITGEVPLQPNAVVRFGDKGPEFTALYGAAARPAQPPALPAVAQGNLKEGIGLKTLEGRLEQAKHDVRREYRWKLVGIVAVVLFLLSGVGVVMLYQWYVFDEQNARNRERLIELEAEKVDFARVGERTGGAIYGVFAHEVRDGNTYLSFIGTAFAINASKFLLGTNSHVANFINQPANRNKKMIVVRSGDTTHAYLVKRAILHPDYREGQGGAAIMCPDVAILHTENVTLDGKSLPYPEVLAAATDSERVSTVKPGAPLCVIGYPGEYGQDYLNLGKAANVAKLVTGSVSAVLKFDAGAADSGSYELLQHTAPTSPGNSGSPILNRKGEVIGLHFSGMVKKVKTIGQDRQGRTVEGEGHVSASAISNGVNVRYLVELARKEFGQDAW
ncbi:MAG: FHA domain-containing protein [Planctomycetota bacterium]|nr:FHA domain-containing protein [Planctomycetota bacterium]